MAAIGSVSFDILHGEVPPLAQAVKVFERPGLDGYEAVTEGDRHAGSVLTGDKLSTNISNANTHISSCMDLQGTIVSVVDDFGVTVANVLVVRVIPSAWAGTGGSNKAVLHAGSSKILTRLMFEVLRTS